MGSLGEANVRKRCREANENFSEKQVETVIALKQPQRDSDVIQPMKKATPKAAEIEAQVENAELQVAGQPKLANPVAAEQEVVEGPGAKQEKTELEAAKVEAVVGKADQLEATAGEAMAAEQGKIEDEEAEQPEAAAVEKAELEAGLMILAETVELAEQLEAEQDNTKIEVAAEAESEAVVRNADQLVEATGVGNGDIGDAELEEGVDGLTYKREFYFECLEGFDDNFSINWDEFELDSEFCNILKEEEEENKVESTRLDAKDFELEFFGNSNGSTYELELAARCWNPFEEKEMQEGWIWYPYSDAELRSFGVFDDKEEDIACNNDLWNFDDNPKP